MHSNTTTPKHTNVTLSSSFPKRGKDGKRSSTSGASADKIEFDDEAIFELNPALKRFSGASLQLASGERASDNRFLPEHFENRVQDEADRIMAETRNILSKLSADIKESRKNISELKKSFDKMNTEVTSLENKYDVMRGAVKERVMQVNFEIYQQKVINHLIEACEEMQLSAFYTTPDKHIVFTDPQFLGTDVDEAAGLTDKQACNLVDSEFGHHHYRR